MNKQDFYNNYKEVFNLDSINWDMPKFGVKGYIKNLPFKVQVSLKNEIDKDSLFYVMGGLIYHLDLAFLRPELSDETRFPKIKVGKLNAIEIDSTYLTKHELDVKPFKFNTKSVETSKFPIMDKDVKPINDYIQQEIKVPVYDLPYNSTFLEDNKNKVDAINALGKFPELATFNEELFDKDKLYAKPLPEHTLNNTLVEHQSPEKFHSGINENFSIENIKDLLKIKEQFLCKIENNKKVISLIDDVLSKIAFIGDLIND